MFLGKNHYEDDKMRISTSKSAPNFESALFLSAYHKFVLALILMKIWDFSYFSSTKTMGIPPTFSFDTTTTSNKQFLNVLILGHKGSILLEI